MTAQPMRPEDVPDEWVTEALLSFHDPGVHIEDWEPETVDGMRDALAAAIPAIRAQVADEITAHFTQERAQVADAEPVTLGGVHEQAKLLGRYDRVIATIDRIARGDQ